MVCLVSNPGCLLGLPPTPKFLFVPLPVSTTDLKDPTGKRDQREELIHAEGHCTRDVVEVDNLIGFPRLDTDVCCLAAIAAVPGVGGAPGVPGVPDVTNVAGAAVIPGVAIVAGAAGAAGVADVAIVAGAAVVSGVATVATVAGAAVAAGVAVSDPEMVLETPAPSLTKRAKKCTEGSSAKGNQGSEHLETSSPTRPYLKAVELKAWKELYPKE
ncbi:hypothetical protein BGX31_006599 [Mortierella sp. GBA43]|nr:hypothetical protein BGX31_006599 [Mortierella sp. GBA43]